MDHGTHHACRCWRKLLLLFLSIAVNVLTFSRQQQVKQTDQHLRRTSWPRRIPVYLTVSYESPVDDCALE